MNQYKAGRVTEEALKDADKRPGLTPPEVETVAVAEPVPKQRRGRKVTGGKSELNYVLQEELFSVAEQLTYFGSAVE